MVAHFYRWEIVQKYIITAINMVLYLEKDLKLTWVGTCSPTGFSHVPNCHLVYRKQNKYKKRVRKNIKRENRKKRKLQNRQRRKRKN